MRSHIPLLYVCALCAISHALVFSSAVVQAAFEVTLLSPEPLSSIAGVDLGRPVAADASKQIRFALPASQMRVLQTPGGWSTALIDGCVLSSGAAGAPQLPMKAIRLALPFGADVRSVCVVSGTIAWIDERLRLSPAPEPGFWPIDGVPSQLREDASIYRSDAPFPRELVRYYVGSDGRQTVLTIQFYPLVFYPTRDRARAVTEAVIQVDYSLASKRVSLAGALDDPQCVIISPDYMSAAANEIALLHEEDGIETEVVTVESIFFSYDEAEDPPYDGYPYGSPITPFSYNYSLAKRIISYLRDTAAHPSLEFVTILGNGANVMPSYYYHDGDSGLWGIHSWIPTDFFYSSPDYDLVPDYKVGRLPARDSQEAMSVALKLRGWRDEADWSWLKNVMLAGSRPFGTPYFYGELMSVDMANSGLFDGMIITKGFGTDGRYTEEVVSQPLKEGGYGFLYDCGHGSGPSMNLDEGYINCADVMNYEGGSWQLPIVVSIACTCGMFDLSPDDIQRHSIGEALVLSDAGGIAYYGGSRINAGIASQAFDNGNLIVTKQEHMGGMTKCVFASYREGVSDLGGLYTGAVVRFLSENDWEDFLVRRTLFEFVLLGDPALRIPACEAGEANEVPVFDPMNPDFMNNQSLPSYTNSQQKTVWASIDSDSSVLNLKLVNATDVQVVARCTAFGPAPDYSFDPAAGFKIYTVRAEADDGKEGWFFVNSASSLLCVDGDLTDWRSEALRPIAADPTGDFDDPEYDLSRLFAYADSDYWHFAFDATCQNQDMVYVLAIDYRDGGYAGIAGQNTDAGGNYVTFDSAFGIDAEIYLRHVTWVPWLGWEAFRNCMLYQYSEESGWSHFGLDSIGAALSYSPVGHVVELAVPKSYLGQASEMNLALFSLPSSEASPAQDSVPSDPATFHSLTLGQEHANTLSRFARASCRPVNCIMGAGFFGSAVSESAGGEVKLAALLDPAAAAPVSMEIALGDVPTGLLLNDEGENGDAVAGDGLWTFGAALGPGALLAGEYLVSIVASDEMGGCAGQWPQLLLSFCDDPGPLSASRTRGIARMLVAAALPEGRAACADGDDACAILAAGVFNSAANLSNHVVEAFAYVGNRSVDSISVCYMGIPLGVELSDDGQGNDLVAGDGIFSGAFNISSQLLSHRSYIVELVPVQNGQPGRAWPYLHVAD
ncbi:MAG: hypothetical protein JW759_00995 [Candidatus Coatesbacteria bacterium]|nr:hypothetical protein [Candidatus Coatesbacteria bacterium]